LTAVNRLVALAMPAGDAFVTELRRAWDHGDAVLPIDLRLPAIARDRLLEKLRPDRVVESGAGHDRTDGVPVEPGDALVVATSGTTGEPKGVVLTHDAVAASARATSDRLSVDSSRDRWLACLPLAHVGGLSVVTRALVTETPLDVHSGFDEAVVLQAQRDGATLVSMVPTMLTRMDVSGFRTVLLGGAAIPPDRPVNTVATYGLTETGSGVVYDHRPLKGVEVRVVDGELQVRGPMLLRAYRDGTDPKTADGWLPTGDAGSVTDGHVEVQGRIGDLIITGGENVWPAPVEAAVRALPSVEEVAVVGRPDPEWGHVVTAVIVVGAGHDAPTVDAVRDAVREVLPAFAAPRRIEQVDRLPLTALGKLKRVEV
jgi:O-succinylbenzoic acid--CoA ligase